MCAIFGIIDRKGHPVSEGELVRARDFAQHRGPDGEGVWAGWNIGLAHRRLSILGLGEQGSQPFTYRYITIIHNGEIYNYLEIREELGKCGHVFDTDTDTEVLAAAYCQWGTDCEQHFNGIWSFALYDAKRHLLFCSRDRFGVKPFYYAEIGGKFCFASEIKQFSAVEGWKAGMNEDRCRDWLLAARHDHCAETLFDGVLQLPAGHQLIFDLHQNQFQIQRYYNIREAAAPAQGLDLEESKGQFRQLFQDAVRLQLRSDVKVGLTLSGGLDSSALAAAMSSQNEGQRLEAFSACFEEKGFNEEPFMQAVVQKNKLLSHIIRPDMGTFSSQLEKVTWHFDEPILTPSDLTHFEVFQYEAIRGVKVNLCGQGADEILAGYDAFYPVFWRSLLPRQPFRAFLEIVGFAWRHPVSLKKRLARFGQKSGSGLEQNPDLSPAQNIREYSFQAIESTVLPYILHSEDRLSMAHGIESRVPFLDHRLVEFCLSLPDDFKIRTGIRKYLMREAMRAELPDVVYRRYDKIGFETPYKPTQRAIPMQDLGLSWRQNAFLAWKKIYFP